MRKTVLRFLTVVLFLVSLNGYAQNDVVTQLDSGRIIDKIKARGYLVVGMIAKDQYPFFFKGKENTLVGLDVDIASNIADLLNVDLRIDRSAQSFNDLIPLVKDGDIDIAVSKLSRTQSRAQEVLFSDPYIVFRQALLLSRIQLAKVSSNDEEIKNVLRTFTGKLGVIENSSYERYARVNFPRTQLVSYSTWDEALNALNNLEVVGVYRDEMEIEKYVLDNPQSNLYLKSAVIQDQQDPIAIAMSAESAHFAFFVNLVLRGMNTIPKNPKELLQRYKNER